VIFNSTAPDGRSPSSYANNISCWVAFRTGQFLWPNGDDPDQRIKNFKRNKPSFAPSKYAVLNIRNHYHSHDVNAAKVLDLDDATVWAFNRVTVAFNESLCLPYRSNANSMDELKEEYVNASNIRKGACQNGSHVRCYTFVRDLKTERKCRVTVRMQAAFALAGALLVKALYMIGTNLLARQKFKTKCLTFGDVVAAAVINPELQVRNECLVNASEAFRSLVSHRCHKHCKADTASTTGDEIGHCQKCIKYNSTNCLAELEHPIVATKYKKSLISNLGFTAVIQMLLLMFVSFFMFAISLVLVVWSTMAQDRVKQSCAVERVSGASNERIEECEWAAKNVWKETSGGWGGFEASAPLAPLAPDTLLSETSAFAISNGAQLVYSLLYLLLIYNITLISMEHDWGSFEFRRKRLRCTIAKGRGFDQSYLLQLPAWVIFPLMALSTMMHWLLSQSISTIEIVSHSDGNKTLGIPAFESSQYNVSDELSLYLSLSGLELILTKRLCLPPIPSGCPLGLCSS